MQPRFRLRFCFAARVALASRERCTSRRFPPPRRRTVAARSRFRRCPTPGREAVAVPSRRSTPGREVIAVARRSGAGSPRTTAAALARPSRSRPRTCAPPPVVNSESRSGDSWISRTALAIAGSIATRELLVVAARRGVAGLGPVGRGATAATAEDRAGCASSDFESAQRTAIAARTSDRGASILVSEASARSGPSPGGGAAAERRALPTRARARGGAANGDRARGLGKHLEPRSSPRPGAAAQRRGADRHKRPRRAAFRSAPLRRSRRSLKGADAPLPAPPLPRLPPFIPLPPPPTPSPLPPRRPFAPAPSSRGRVHRSRRPLAPGPLAGHRRRSIQQLAVWFRLLRASSRRPAAVEPPWRRSCSKSGRSRSAPLPSPFRARSSESS